MAVVAAFAALTGPADYCWLVMGIGLCLAMLGNAAFGFRELALKRGAVMTTEEAVVAIDVPNPAEDRRDARETAQRRGHRPSPACRT